MNSSRFKSEINKLSKNTLRTNTWTHLGSKLKSIIQKMTQNKHLDTSGFKAAEHPENIYTQNKHLDSSGLSLIQTDIVVW